MNRYRVTVKVPCCDDTVYAVFQEQGDVAYYFCRACQRKWLINLLGICFSVDETKG